MRYLREKIKNLDSVNMELNDKFKKVQQQNKNLFELNQKMSKSLRKGNQKL